MALEDQVAFIAAGGVSSPSSTVVSVEQVTDVTGVVVDLADIKRAQFMVSTASGLDLADAAAFALLSPADQRHLSASVMWQCVHLKAHPDAFTGTAGNIASASANGASVTYREGAEADLAPFALRELNACSWRAQPVKARTLRPYARSQDPRGPQPDPWVRIR